MLYILEFQKSGKPGSRFTDKLFISFSIQNFRIYLGINFSPLKKSPENCILAGYNSSIRYDLFLQNNP